MRRDGLQNRAKGAFDFATDADNALEDQLREALSPLFKGIPFIGEESTEGGDRLPSTYVTVDPIDGTFNFANNLEDWGILIALVEDFEPTMGCMYLPEKKRFYFAKRGHGCFCNSQPRKALIQEQDLSQSLIICSPK